MVEIGDFHQVFAQTKWKFDGCAEPLNSVYLFYLEKLVYLKIQFYYKTSNLSDSILTWANMMCYYCSIKTWPPIYFLYHL